MWKICLVLNPIENLYYILYNNWYVLINIFSLYKISLYEVLISLYYYHLLLETIKKIDWKTRHYEKLIID